MQIAEEDLLRGQDEEIDAASSNDSRENRNSGPSRAENSASRENKRNSK